ncbi:MAG TPA: F0F1 ATP synthase subunit gamma [Candidatus Saccharimonadales bacterium]|nr:F0F1 ATP synthase subunit gamma [Candidatus Saccharimonadales bacterium]
MASKREIQSELETLSGLQTMVEAFEEIGTSKMRKVRDSVLHNRDFLDNLNNIFAQVKRTYTSQVETLMKKKKITDIKKLSFRKTNGKTVFVLLSSNAGFYGDIIKRTFELFLENIKKTPNAEAVVIGKMGLAYFTEENVTIPYTYFDLSDVRTDNDSMKKIITHLIAYEKIYVFHGKFQSLVVQNPSITSISGDLLESTQSQNAPVVKYIFEPSLETIMNFFETEIFASVFEQSVHESELSKYASRMVSLDASVVNIKNQIQKVKFEESRLRHRIENRKQLNVLASMVLWNT